MLFVFEMFIRACVNVQIVKLLVPDLLCWQPSYKKTYKVRGLFSKPVHRYWKEREMAHQCWPRPLTKWRYRPTNCDEQPIPYT